MAEKITKKKKSKRDLITNILLGVFVILMIIPQTRMPIMSFVQRTIAFSPSVKSNKEQLTDYNWPLQTMDGEQFSFSRSQDKVVFLNFWATWCPPCVAEMPYIQNIYDAYGDKVDFYFVTDETSEKVDAFMNKHGYSLPIQTSRYAPPELLQSKALPTTYVIGKDGRIHIAKKGSARWDSKSVRNLLDELLEE